METNGKINWHKVKAILFDIDGTLSDTDDQMVIKVKRILKPMVFFLSDEKKHKLARWLVMAVESPGNFIYNLADRFDLDSLFIKILNRRSRKKKHTIKKFLIIPGTKEMLIYLTEIMPLGVVSARDEASSLAFINQFNLGPYFQTMVTSQTCRRTKPFPDPLLRAAEQLGVAAENCLMVGDTTVDIRAANLAGMQSLGVLCGFGTLHELVRAGATQILNSPTELLDLVKEHLSKNNH